MNRRRFVTLVAALAAWTVPAAGRTLRRLSRRPRVPPDVLARIRARTRPLDSRDLAGPHDLAG